MEVKFLRWFDLMGVQRHFEGGAYLPVCMCVTESPVI